MLSSGGVGGWVRHGMVRLIRWLLRVRLLRCIRWIQWIRLDGHRLDGRRIGERLMNG